VADVEGESDGRTDHGGRGERDGADADFSCHGTVHPIRHRHLMGGSALGALAVNAAITLGLTIVLIMVTFVVAGRRGRYDTIDSAWGLGFAAIAAVSLGLSVGHGELTGRALVAALTVVWGLRLSIHIHTRNRGQGEDARYAAMVAKAGDSPGRYLLTRVYLVQAALMWVISLPVQAAQYAGGQPGVVGWIGVAVWLVGIGFEGIGDAQLSRFKADPANRGIVLDRGLWRYTRHPNYFGDACVWWGLYLLACHSWAGTATIFAPLVMTALLTKGSGKPILERAMLSRGPAYADYVRRTSGFFPLPPKRPAPGGTTGDSA
jgi:steroid 5-alpha reductase family enzyme